MRIKNLIAIQEKKFERPFNIFKCFTFDLTLRRGMKDGMKFSPRAHIHRNRH